MRLVKNDAQYTKYKELYQIKSDELKRSNDMVAYYKKMMSKLRQAKTDDDDSENKRPTLDNVMLNN